MSGDCPNVITLQLSQQERHKGVWTGGERTPQDANHIMHRDMLIADMYFTEPTQENKERY